MRLIMTLLVRDEEDIVAANLDFHLDQGVDFVVVTDNGSQDRTPSIVGTYVERGVARLIHESADDYDQARWVTRMARIAAREHAADWVINNDADEFWFPCEHRTLKAALETVPDEVPALVAHRRNFVPRPPDGRPFYERMTVRETHATNALGDPLPPKMCHRASPDVAIGQGNHTIEGISRQAALDDGRVDILHFPLRSYRQFENKIVKGGRAYERNTELSPTVGRTWRHLYGLWLQGQLPAHYDTQTFDEASIRRGLADGVVAHDTRLRDYLERIYGRSEPPPAWLDPGA